MKNLFLNLFNRKIEIDSKAARKSIYSFCSINDKPEILNTVTNVKVLQGFEKLTVEITTQKPGILIGKGGKVIDALQEKLTEDLGTPVDIDLKESDLWLHLYK